MPQAKVPTGLQPVKEDALVVELQEATANFPEWLQYCRSDCNALLLGMAASEIDAVAASKLVSKVAFSVPVSCLFSRRTSKLTR